MLPDKLGEGPPLMLPPPGLVQLRPHEATWYFADRELGGRPCPVHREQLPVMPLLACPLYGLQGTTADPV